MDMTIQDVSRWLLERDRFLILTHKRPDGDTVGCAVGLCCALREQGKAAWVLPNEDATPLMDPYLTAEVLAPAEFVPETVVAVDIASTGLFPSSAEKYKGRVDLAIDHHPTHENFAALNYVEADKAACGEIIYAIVSGWGPTSQAVALPLYLAVSTDTGCFVYSNTSANTHRVAAALMETGIDVFPVNKRHFRTKSLKRLQLESLLIQRVEFYYGGTLAVAPVTRDLLDAVGATSEDTDEISSFAGQIQGVRHAVTIREYPGGEFRISVRTDPGELDASRVCALLGGGGHAAASGCTVNGTVDDAKRAILQAIETVRNG